MRREKLSDASVALHFGPDDEHLWAQFEVLYDALMIYEERNPKYKDNWRRFGWRGCLFRIRERAERLWDDFWDKEPQPFGRALHDARPGETVLVEPIEYSEPPSVDDAIDAINMLGFFVRAVRENNRDGSWW